MIILIDHYDSFTFNLYQLLGELGEKVEVIRYDQISVPELKQLQPKAIILSPGPGHPEQIPETLEIITRLHQTIPILGICLGHQAIGYAFGARITKASLIKHGKTSAIAHNGNRIFSGLEPNLEVMRYHSLVIQKTSLSSCFEILATSMDDNEIMAIKHKQYSLYGVQFHPESIGTKDGKQLLRNFLHEVKGEPNHEGLSTKIS
jgi:anthranilate synthase component II